MRPAFASIALVSIGVVSVSGSARGERGVEVALAANLGESIQTDAYVAGARIQLRHRSVPFVEADLGALGGIGPDFWSLRPGGHLRAVLQIRSFRLHALFGASALIYWPRGDFARFCDKAEIDCAREEFGLDLGLGFGWRGLGLEAIVGTGNLPLFTFLVEARLWL